MREILVFVIFGVIFIVGGILFNYLDWKIQKHPTINNIFLEIKVILKNILNKLVVGGLWAYSIGLILGIIFVIFTVIAFGYFLIKFLIDL